MAIYVPKRDYSANLVANYKFSETSGTTCVDAKGAYNGIYTGTTSVTDGGQTFRRFNGVDDYIGFSQKVTPIGKKSIKFRMKTTQNTYGIIFCNSNNSGASGDNGLNVSINEGVLRFSLREGASVVLGISSFSTINDGKWHDILFTWDGTINSDGVKLYIDDLSTPIVKNIATKVETLAPVYNLYIGRRYVNTSYLFQGDLDNVEVYNDVIEFFYIKYLVNQNSKYYSIKSNFYELGAPVDNATLEHWYDKYGADDLSSITANLTSRDMPMTLDGATGIWKTDFQLDANLVQDSVEMLEVDADNKVIKHGSPIYRIYDDYLVPEFNINMLKK